MSSGSLHIDEEESEELPTMKSSVKARKSVITMKRGSQTMKVSADDIDEKLKDGWIELERK